MASDRHDADLAEAGSSRQIGPSHLSTSTHGSAALILPNAPLRERSTTPLPAASLAVPLSTTSSPLTSLDPSPVKPSQSSVAQHIPSSLSSVPSKSSSNAKGLSATSMADRLRAEARQRAVQEEEEEEQRRRSRRRFTSASPEARNGEGSGAARASSSRHVIGDSDDDSDGSLGSLVLSMTKRPRVVLSPRLASRSPSEGAGSSHDQGSGSVSPAKRPRRSAAQPSKYRFEPKMYKSSRAKAQPTAAELAHITPAAAVDRHSIDALLREKKRHQRKGVDEKGIQAVRQSITEWEGRRVDVHEKPEAESEVDRALRDLENAYVARAEEGLQSPASRGESEEHDYESKTRARTSSTVDYGFFEKVEKRSKSDQGVTSRSDVLEALKKTVVARDGDEDDDHDDGEQDQQRLLDIVAHEGQAEQRGSSTGASKHAYHFWHSGPLSDPSAHWSHSSHPLTMYHGPYQKDVSTSFVAGLLKAGEVASSDNHIRIKPDIVAAAVHGDEAIAGMAFKVASEQIKQCQIDEGLLGKVVAMIGRELRALGAQEVGESAFKAGWRERERRDSAPITANTSNSSKPAVLSSLERQVRIERALRLMLVILALPTAPHWLCTSLRLAFLTDAHCIACDDWSRGASMQALLEEIMERKLAALSWATYEQMPLSHAGDDANAGEGWGKWILDWLPDPKKDITSSLTSAAKMKGRATWPLFHSMLNRFANTSTKARTVRRSKAYLSHISGLARHEYGAIVGPIVPDLKILCDVIESEDPRVNPLWVPPASGPNISYRDVEARTQILAIALSDLALQLCSPTKSRTTEAASASAGTEGEPSTTQQSAADSEEELLASGALESTGLAKPAVGTSTAATTSLPRPTATTSTSKSSLDRNAAFLASTQPYLSDTALLSAFHLGAASLAPDFGRLKQVHRLVALLRMNAGRIMEGRRAGTGVTRDGVNGSEEQEEEDTIWRSRAKDAMQRLALTLTYQCEAYTRFRIAGVDAGNESTDAGRGTSDGDDDTPDEQANSSQRMKKNAGGGRVATGPRASDQRSLDSFFRR